MGLFGWCLRVGNELRRRTELHSERFVDCAPAQVWATLLDEGVYLASERTMYRLLDGDQEVRERRESALKSRLTRSGLRVAVRSAIVVRHGLPRRLAP